MLESYIRTGDGKEYVDVDCVREALGIVDDDVDFFRVIKKLREDNDLLEELYANHISQLNDYAELAFELGIESGDAESIKDYIVSLKRERDELKEKCDKLKARANAAYGVSCGYSSSTEPAFLCNVISYSWEFGSMLNSDSIRVELDLTPTANCNGTFDMEDLKHYIQAYGREKKLSDFEIFCKLVNNCIDELCDKYNVVQPARKSTTKKRLDYIFSIIAEYRDFFVEGFKKEKQAAEDSLTELRAKIREIYRSVVDDEWDEHLSYISALNDINEEHKRVVHNFEERTADWSKAQQELDRYRLAIGSLCNIPAEHRDDISWIEDAFNHTKKDYMKWKATADKLARFHSNICTALCLGGETDDEDILNAIAEDRKESNKLTVFRNNVAKAVGLTVKDSNSDIINRVVGIRESHEKLCKDYTELHKAIWEAMDRNPEALPDETARLVGEVRMLHMNYKNMHDLFVDYGAAQKILSDISDFRKWAIEELKQHGIVSPDLEHPERIDVTGSDIFRKLLKRYDWAYDNYRSQYGLRQQWYARYESEHDRANGVQKALDREREKCRVKDISLETAKEQYKKVCSNLETAECALNGMKSKMRSLQEEKTKVISALGQDIWDDCLK